MPKPGEVMSADQVLTVRMNRIEEFLKACPGGSATLEEVKAYCRILNAQGLGRFLIERLVAEGRVTFDPEAAVVSLREGRDR